VTYLENLTKEPWRHDLFDVLRAIERSFVERPRIGHSVAPREDVVTLGQDPFLEFPASNLAEVRPLGNRRYFISVRFLDIFNNRFIQLFFRAWADARPIAQHDRPRQDRFATYLGTAIGIGSSAHRNTDTIPDPVKLHYAGLLAGGVKSPSRLRSLILGVFGIEVEVEPYVGQWLDIEPDDQMRFGGGFMRVGADTMLGAKIYSVQDKIRLRLKAEDLATYEKFLPGGAWCRRLADLVFFYLGHEVDYDIELTLPANKVPPMRIGESGRLGWTGWMDPDLTVPDDVVRADARFHLESRRHAGAL
jgi:type VI secretion system protein ImpH